MVIYIKTVGIILREFTENNKIFLGTRNDLFTTLEQFNINILGIPLNNHYKNIINIVNLCDGIILPGGDTSSKNEYKLIKYLYAKDIPTLGICLGMQNMAKVFNNYQEIKVPNHYFLDLYVHKIIINNDSKLYKIIKKSSILVNSRHHDAIPETKLKVSALSSDGVIEAIEDSSKKFFVGLEWHPESTNDNNSFRIFKSFIDSL